MGRCVKMTEFAYWSFWLLARGQELEAYFEG